MPGAFRHLPQQSGYNKRLRNAVPLLNQVIRMLAIDTDLWTRRSLGSRLHPRWSAPAPARLECPCCARPSRHAAIWHHHTTGQPTTRSLTAYDH